MPEHNNVESSLDLPEVVSEEQKTAEVVESEMDVPIGPKACEDNRFIRFFKMVQFGVPAVAVKLKMKAEGLDPSVLE